MQKNKIVIYTSKDGIVKVDTTVLNDTIWMNQTELAKLFDTTKNNISLHMKNIFESRELEEQAVVKKFLTTASDGKKYNVNHYNLYYKKRLLRCKS